MIFVMSFGLFLIRAFDRKRFKSATSAANLCFSMIVAVG